MIILDNVSKQYKSRAGPVSVLNHVNLIVRPGEKLGILGRNGAGKSTLIKLISGAERATSGSIVRQMSVSWPLAFGGAFQGALTGIDNLRFICRVYGTTTEDKIAFVEEFAELGKYLREPVKTYSSGMSARLAFAISMVIEFDCFLIDEIVAVGDSRFHQKCEVELFEKRADRAMVIVSHDASYIREHCHTAAVLRDGKIAFIGNVDEAISDYQATSV